VLCPKLAQAAQFPREDVGTRKEPLSDRRAGYMVRQRLDRHDAALLQVTESVVPFAP
jgi:hypothetical protein